MTLIKGTCTLADYECVRFENVLGAEIPAQEHDAIIYIQDGDVVAENGNVGEIDSGTDGVDNHSVILSTLNGDYKNIYFRPQDVHVLQQPLYLESKDNIVIRGNGSTLKLCDDYSGYYYNGKYLFYINNCENFDISGLLLDGNRNNITQNDSNKNIIMEIRNSSGFIEHNNFVRANYKCIDVNDSKLTVSKNLFNDNLYETENYGSEIYCNTSDLSNDKTIVNFLANRFVRTSNARAHQCYYMNYGTYNYSHDVFESCQLPYDFRNGIHNIDAAFGTDCKLSLIAQDGNPQTTMKNSAFHKAAGFPASHNSFLKIATGSATINNCFFSAGVDTSVSYGIEILSDQPCIVSGNNVDGSKIVGINIYNSCGNHVIRENRILNSPVGIKSDENTLNSVIRENTFSGVTTEYSDLDGKLVVYGFDSP